jgi:glycosyltransferase involved in cell wall biosynthesis
LDYLPNLDAIKIIIGEITPVLKLMNLDYRILICGNRLPKEWEDVLLTTNNIIYLGYVDSISPYLYGADCFINPVTLGGGIKTKLIDALSHNLTSISTNSGAQGINPGMTQKKLILVNDLDWVEFAKVMAELDMKDEIQTPDAFYKHFNWNTIVKKALLYLQEK